MVELENILDRVYSSNGSDINEIEDRFKDFCKYPEFLKAARERYNRIKNIHEQRCVISARQKKFLQQMLEQS